MPVGPADEGPSRASRTFDAAVSVAGVLIAAGALLALFRSGTGPVELLGAVALAIPLILFLGHFEVSLGSTLPSPNEPYVTFESAVLVFLACTVDLDVALLAWVFGQAVLNGSASISLPVRVFNGGLMVFSGAVAYGVIAALGGINGAASLLELRTLVTVAAGSLAYLLCMYAVLMMSVALESGIRVREAVGVRPALRATAALSAINGLGLLSAIMVTRLPLWTIVLLLGPVVAVLLTTRALSRAAEQRQRLAALFDATKQIQLSSTYDDIIAVMREQAPKIVGTGGAELRGRPPSGTDFGVQVRNAHQELWVVGTGLNRTASRRQADLDALQALATVVEEALLRTSLAEEMSRMAHHDALTGLPNRTLFLDRAELAVAAAHSADVGVAVLFVDLDGFKSVNDRFGHSAGDALLVAVASRLLSSVRSVDLVGRLGGDEFAVLVEQVSSVDQLLELGDRIIATLSAGLVVRGHEVSVGASIGIAVAAPDDDADALIRHADRAMYDAKSHGKNHCRLYRRSLVAGLTDRP